MKIDQKSLHHRLFEHYGRGNMWELEHDRLNFCQYSRRVGVGFLVTLLCVVTGTFVALGPLQLIASGMLWMFTDNGLMWFIEPITMIDGGSWINVLGLAAHAVIVLEGLLALTVAVVVVIMLIRDWYENRDTGEKPKKIAKPDGFMMTWYKSKKDKYCPMVTLYDEESPRVVETWPVYGDND